MYSASAAASAALSALQLRVPSTSSTNPPPPPAAANSNNNNNNNRRGGEQGGEGGGGEQRGESSNTTSDNARHREGNGGRTAWSGPTWDQHGRQTRRAPPRASGSDQPEEKDTVQADGRKEGEYQDQDSNTNSNQSGSDVSYKYHSNYVSPTWMEELRSPESPSPSPLHGSNDVEANQDVPQGYLAYPVPLPIHEADTYTETGARGLQEHKKQQQQQEQQQKQQQQQQSKRMEQLSSLKHGYRFSNDKNAEVPRSPPSLPSSPSTLSSHSSSSSSPSPTSPTTWMFREKRDGTRGETKSSNTKKKSITNSRMPMPQDYDSNGNLKPALTRERLRDARDSRYDQTRNVEIEVQDEENHSSVANSEDWETRSTVSELRSQLKSLEYEGYVDENSAPVVQALLGDLVVATESYERVNEENDKLKRQIEDGRNEEAHHGGNDEHQGEQRQGRFDIDTELANYSIREAKEDRENQLLELINAKNDENERLYQELAKLKEERDSMAPKYRLSEEGLQQSGQLEQAHTQLQSQSQSQPQSQSRLHQRSSTSSRNRNNNRADRLSRVKNALASLESKVSVSESQTKDLLERIDKGDHDAILRLEEIANWQKNRDEDVYGKSGHPEGDIDSIEEKEDEEDHLKEQHQEEQRASELRSLRMRNRELEQLLESSKKAADESRAECKRLATVASSAARDGSGLREELKRAIDKQYELEKTVNDLEERLQRESFAKARKLDEIENLKVVAVRAQVAQQNADDRSKQLESFAEQESEAKRKLLTEMQKLREKVDAEAEKASAAQHEAKEVAAQKEAMEEEVKQSRVALEHANTEKNKHESKQQELESQISELRRRLHNQIEVLNSRDGDVTEMQKKISSLQEQIEEYKKAYQARCDELKAASQDLSSMTRENQALNESYRNLKQERNNVVAHHEESQAQVSRLRGFLESAKVDQQDLNALYKKVCAENERLHKALNDLSYSQAELSERRKTENEEVSYLKRALAELQAVTRRQKVDIQNYDKQLSEVAKQLQMERRKVRDTTSAREDAERKAHDVSEAEERLSDEVQHLRWELGETKSSLETTSNRLNTILQEHSELKSALSQERRRTQRLEALLGQVREQQATSTSTTANLERDSEWRAQYNLPQQRYDYPRETQRLYTQTYARSGEVGAGAGAGTKTKPTKRERAPGMIQHQQREEKGGEEHVYGYSSSGESGTESTPESQDYHDHDQSQSKINKKSGQEPGNLREAPSHSQFQSQSHHGGVQVEGTESVTDESPSGESSDLDQRYRELEQMVSEQASLVKWMQVDMGGSSSTDNEDTTDDDGRA